jgi:hypothetical protein
MTLKAIDGLPIIDGKKAIKLTITPNDIAKADRKESADCAVARACRRELHAKEVRVHLTRVFVRMNEGNWQRFATPPAMRSEIIAFDRGGSFEPGEFVLSPPVGRDKATGKRQGGKPKFKHARQNPNRKKRKTPHVVTDVRSGPA